MNTDNKHDKIRSWENLKSKVEDNYRDHKRWVKTRREDEKQNKQTNKHRGNKTTYSKVNESMYMRFLNIWAHLRLLAATEERKLKGLVT